MVDRRLWSEKVLGARWAKDGLSLGNGGARTPMGGIKAQSSLDKQSVWSTVVGWLRVVRVIIMRRLLVDGRSLVNGGCPSRKS